ncbi:MAG: sigma 54-interacting transcriptional regulator, partial [candidate division WOR-3 bacterium]
ALINSALPYMKLCSESFKLCGSILVLTDKEGFILKELGPQRLLEGRTKIGLGEGGSLREEDAGTTAVALAIRHQKPVYVEGEEYYLKIFQSGACFCAPILDKDELLGTIVIVHPERKGHPYTFMLVKMLAEIIQQEYQKNFEFNFYSDLAKLLNLIFVVTDTRGNICWLSERAKKVLVLDPNDNITRRFGANILKRKSIVNDLFESESLNMKFFVLRKEWSDKYLFIFEPASQITCSKKEVPFHAPYTFEDIIGLESIKKFARQLAVQETNLLIIGESGTGKDLLASAIHNESHRAHEKFVVVNCAAIPENLFESELFGYKRGAFTDARHDKIGKIEFANNGTVFFDEIAELPLNVQAKLLRVLEDKKVIPLGSNEGRVVNVRFIFATNRNLEEMITQGKFREDLYYRIHSPKIEIPPLRERRNEIPLLIEHLLGKIKERHKGFVAGITERAKRALLNFDYPGNVRQLEKMLEQAFLSCRKEYIDIDDLGLAIAKPLTLEEKVLQYKAKLIFEVFIANGRDVKKTCKELGLSERQIYRYLKMVRNQNEE